MLKILLLGSTGMVGTAVETICKKRDIEYVALSHEDLEITNVAGVKSAIEKHKPTIVINSVALVGTDPCEAQPERAFTVNAVAVSNLAKHCEKFRSTLVQISTAAVFDGGKDGCYTEDDQPNPINIYGASKYTGEIFARNFCSKYYIVRFPILFGKRRNKKIRFVDKVLEEIKKGEVRVADDRIDSPTYTIDAAAALISILEKEKPFGIYHVANSGMVSYYDFVAKLIQILNVRVNLVRAKDKDFKSLGYKPLNTALKSIKLEPIRNWQDALYEYVTREVKI